MFARRILAWVLLGTFLSASVVAAQERRLDRDRNRRTDDQQTEGRRQQLPERQPQVVPRRPPHERFDRWILGVSVTYDDTGAVITHVDRDSAAWEFGLERRDQIVAVNGYQVGYVGRQLYPLERELHLRADRRGSVRLLVQNHRNQRLVNIDVKMRRAVQDGDRDRPDRPSRLGAIIGTVDSRVGGQVPRNSVLVIRLIDTTSRITTIKPLAQQSFRDPGPFPVPFELTFDMDRIEEGREYALHATLTVNGLTTQRTHEGTIVDFGTRGKRYQLVLHRR